ncbi:VUT family protein [Shewanella sp. 202IG2-18]|uniref:VUT family protein n=1 Tax=Parashewanella hymeniacidonis TaxID=2807618 RepID=UPI001960EAE1|nr:VUT family protein [Parashewanella hymeniacidonis]
MLCLTVCFANNFISIQGITLPGGILVFPITFIICDVVSEVYGYSIAKAFIWIGIIAELIFSSLSLFISKRVVNTVFTLIFSSLKSLPLLSNKRVRNGKAYSAALARTRSTTKTQ